MEFYQTGYGRKFFEAQLPKLIKEIGRVADALEERNEFLKELNGEENRKD